MHSLRFLLSRYSIILLMLLVANALGYILNQHVKQPIQRDTTTSQIHQNDKAKIMNLTAQDLPHRGSETLAAVLTYQPDHSLGTDLFGGLPFLNLHEGFAYDHAAQYHYDIAENSGEL